MYQVKCDEFVIYDLRDSNLKIISPKLTTEVNKTGTFDFTIPEQNPYYDKIKKLKSIITIYQDGEEIWRGRVINDKLDFYNRKQVECEGELAFLLDTLQRPYSFQGTPQDFFTKIIQNHNAAVEDSKKFEIRNISVSDPNDYTNREDSSYTSSWDTINNKLINTYGGYLESGPLENGKRYIDYIKEYNRINSQTIEFGKNLLDITQYAKGEEIKTAIIPLGKDGLTISSVNNGKDFIYNETAVNLFGWIYGTVEYSDVTDASNLLNKAKEYLETVINENLTIELSAVDLHYLNCDISKFRKGDMVRVISIPHKLDKYFQVSKLTISLDNPKSSKITLGQTFSTLTQKQVNNTKNVEETIVMNFQETEKIQKEVVTLKEDVQKMDDTIVKIPDEYVKVNDFENYKKEINQNLGNVYTVKGSVKNYDALTQIEEKEVGDVYNLLDTGANYVWTDSGWDKLSETINLDSYYTKDEIDKIIEQIKGGTE